MSNSERNEQKPEQEFDDGDDGGNPCINIETDDSFPIIDKVSQIPEEASLYLDNRSIQEASTKLIKTTLSSLPVHPNFISNVKGPVLEVHRAGDECVDVKIVHSFRAHFGTEQNPAGAYRLHDEREARLLDVSDAPSAREEIGRGSLDIVPRRRSTSPWNEGREGSREPAGCDVVPSSGERLISARLPSSPWELDPRQITVGHRIAVGGFAEVFVGKYEGTVVAIKRLIDGDVSAISKFESEVAMLARMRHPNLILFMGYCMSPQLCIVSEFMQKGCLHSILRRREGVVLEPKLQRMVAISVARGMAYLHSRSPPILHLDLKSPNILVDNNWRVKITDFGLSQMRFRTLVSHAGSGAGSPHWMAPESLRSEHVDERADVYSYGVVLWELITGKMPWENLNAMQVVGAVGFRGRTLPVPEEGDPVLIKLFEACCQGDPKDRPSFPDILEIFAGQAGGGEGNKGVCQPLLADSKGKRFRDDTCVDMANVIEGKEKFKSNRMLEGTALRPPYRTVVKAVPESPSRKSPEKEGSSSPVLGGLWDHRLPAVDMSKEGGSSEMENPPPPVVVQQSPFAMLALEPFESEAPKSESDGGRGRGEAGAPQGSSEEGFRQETTQSPITMPPPEAPSAGMSVSPFAQMAGIPFGDGENDQESSRENKEPEVGVGLNGSSAAPSPFAALSTVPFQSWGDVANASVSGKEHRTAVGNVLETSTPSIVAATILSVPDHLAKDPPAFPSTASEIAFKPVESQTNTVGPLTLSPFPDFSSVGIACDENSPATVETGSTGLGIEQAVSGEWKIKVAEVDLDDSGAVAEDPLQEDETVSAGRWGSGSVEENSCRGNFGMDDAGPSKSSKGDSVMPTHIPTKLETEEGRAMPPPPPRRKGGFCIPPIVFTQDPSKAALAGVFAGGSSSVTRKPRGFLISKFAGSQDPQHSVSCPEGRNLWAQLSGSESDSDADF
ncbi:hypothetical protein BSKO_03161 [Bryopsis sp. KO-2023]|nr:hypothetical protein BSKO_03161 [Bryopsis sp. KO-2023]